MHRILRPLMALLLLAILLAPLTAQPSVVSSAPAQNDRPELSQAPTPLPNYTEVELGDSTRRNDTPISAEAIGPLTLPPPRSWSRAVTGTIASSSDIDFFRFVVPSPASRVRIALSGLPADYDLVFGGGSQQAGDGSPILDSNFDPGQPGLEGITQVGSSISAIGSSISAIGSSISAIGSSISAIGSSISAISANADLTPEAIDTFVWQPGIYFVAVTASNGQFSERPYQLTVSLEGSALAAPPPAPTVSVQLFPPAENAERVTTLYLYHPQRLANRYGLSSESLEISSITEALQDLALAPPNPNPTGRPLEYGVVLNLSDLVPTLGNTRTLSDVYQLWDSNAGNPLYANYIARLIDNIIKATLSGEAPSNPDFVLGDQETPIAFPNVRNIVLVGGDDVFPFFRLPDLTTIANEADYLEYTRAVAGGEMLDPTKPLGAALRYRMLLSDNPYGSERPYRFYGAPLFLPTLAVGRLVETPAEIAAYLNEYASGPDANFFLDVSSFGQPEGPTRAFVSGYDFLQDQAEAISRIFEDAGLQRDEYNALINDQWTRTELERDWFDGRLNTGLPLPPEVIFPSQAQISLSSVNAHFDHWQVLPAQNPLATPAGNFPASRLLAPQYDPLSSFYNLYFARTLGYSVGCHSGYNVPVSALSARRELDRVTYSADFAQALLRHGGNWIGNTGYGYGTADGIDYSERLAVLLTEEFARDVLGLPNEGLYPTIGDALLRAKQRYVRNAATLSEYDYKTLSIMSLYGLPYIGVNVSNPLTPPTEDPTPDGGAPLQTPAPLASDQETGQLIRTITFTLEVDNEAFVDVPRTGSQQFQISPENFTVEDSFVDQGFPAQLPRVFENNQVGAPALPTFAYDISALSSSDDDSPDRLTVRDVVFAGGVYDQREFQPLITQVVTETTTPIISTTTSPDFSVGAGLWLPDKFYGYSTVGTGDLQRDQLTSYAAQFRANADGRTGVLRPYSKMVFRVTYDDPAVETETAQALRADETPPVIESVVISDTASLNQLARVEQSQLIVTARDEDAQGNLLPPTGLTVSALFIQDGVNWIELQLEADANNPGRFTVLLPAAAPDARYIVRATDAAGNTTYFTAGGRFTVFEPDPPPLLLYMPLVRR